VTLCRLVVVYRRLGGMYYPLLNAFLTLEPASHPSGWYSSLSLLREPQMRQIQFIMKYAVRSFETCVNCYRTTQHHIPVDSTLHNHPPPEPQISQIQFIRGCVVSGISLFPL
jgi:hypothetical protein